MQRQLVSRPEDTDGDLSAIGHKDLVLLHDGTVGTDSAMHMVAIPLEAFLKDLILVAGSHVCDIDAVQYSRRYCLLNGTGWEDRQKRNDIRYNG
jgi:hypothetical protein